MKKPKILFVAHHYMFDSGAEHSFFEIIKGARKRGYGIHVTSPRGGEFVKVLKKHGFDHSVIEYGRWPGLDPEYDDTTRSWQAVDELCKIIEVKKIDVVMTNTSVMPWAAVAAARMNKPHIWHICEFPIEMFNVLSGYYEFIKTFSNAVIANSQQLTDYIAKHFAIRDVICARSYTNTHKLGYRGKTPRLVNVGIIHSHKNQLEILKAVVELRDHYHHNLDVILVGRYDTEQAYFKQIKHYIKQHRLEDAVTFKGFREDRYKFIGPNDILIQPSVSESIGRVIIEGISLGLICVGSDIPGNREAFSVGGGHLYKAGESQELAKKLNTILDDLPTYQSQAKKFQQKVIHELSEANCHDPIFAVVDDVANQSNPMVKMGLLTPLTQALVKEVGEQSAIIKKQQADLAELRQGVLEITDSKSWKAVLKLRKLLGR